MEHWLFLLQVYMKYFEFKMEHSLFLLQVYTKYFEFKMEQKAVWNYNII